MAATQDKLMKKRDTPAFAQAYLYLERLLEKKSDPGGSLPSIAALSRDAGVSLVTMSRAVRSLVTEGRLVTVRGVGVFCASNRNIPLPIRPLRPRSTYRSTYQRIMERMHQDALTGVIKPASNDFSIKALGQRYGANYRTLRKALNSLVSEYGSFSPHPARIKAYPGNPIIYLLAWGQVNGVISFANPWAQDNLRTLERVCALNGTQLRVLTYNSLSPERGFFSDSTGRLLTRIPEIDRCLGFVVWTIGPATTVDAVIRHAGSYGKPVAVLDEEHRFDLMSPIKSLRYGRLFRFSANAGPPRAMARYLMSRGHRSVAYVCGFHNNEWSRLRCSEIVRTFGAAGFTGAVTEFTVYKVFGPDEFYKDERLPEYINALLKGRLPRLLGAQPLPIGAFADAYSKEAMGIMQKEVMRQELIALFDEALSHVGITAWVCGNDLTALMALTYLRQKNIEVPGRLSVSGFNDEPEALAHDLTSYNFNLDGVVHAMVCHVLRPHFTPRTNPVTEIEGMVMERGSTGSVRATGFFSGS